MTDLLDSKYYHVHSSKQEAWALAFLENYSFRGDEHILDIGCGDGKISAHIAEQVPRGKVIGIDPSRNMIQFAKDHFSCLPNVDFQMSDAAQLHIKEAFDLVVSFSAFHWVEDQNAAFKAIYRSMRPGATLMIFSAFEATYPLSIAYKEMREKHLVGQRDTFHGRPPGYYENILPIVGFSEWEVSILDLPVVYKDCDELTNWINAWAPSATGLDQEASFAFSQKVSQHICCDQGCLNDDGSVSFVFPRLQVVARK